MTSKEIIQKRKEILYKQGITESETLHNNILITPSEPGLDSMGSATTFKRNRSSSLEKYYIKNRLIGEHFLVDGGVKSGYDVFMYLTLGADAVLAGRTLLYSAIGGGQEGVALTLSKMEAQLKAAMLYTGCSTLERHHCKYYQTI